MPWLAKLKRLPRGYDEYNLVFQIGRIYRVTKTGTRNVSVNIDKNAGEYVITADTARRLFEQPYWVKPPIDTSSATSSFTSNEQEKITSSLPQNLPEMNPKSTPNIDEVRRLYSANTTDTTEYITVARISMDGVKQALDNVKYKKQNQG